VGELFANLTLCRPYCAQAKAIGVVTELEIAVQETSDFVQQAVCHSKRDALLLNLEPERMKVERIDEQQIPVSIMVVVAIDRLKEHQARRCKLLFHLVVPCDEVRRFVETPPMRRQTEGICCRKGMRAEHAQRRQEQLIVERPTAKPLLRFASAKREPVEIDGARLVVRDYRG